MDECKPLPLINLAASSTGRGAAVIHLAKLAAAAMDIRGFFLADSASPSFAAADQGLDSSAPFQHNLSTFI